MKPLPFLTSPDVFIEIGQSSLRVLIGEHGLELPLERLENGRLAAPCKERLTHSLREFVQKHAGRSRQTAFCAIAARGVSLRRLTLPAAGKEELERLLLFQIEKEFPLAPDELAWGCRALQPAAASGNGSPAPQEFLVIAVKKDTLLEYETLFSECGLTPVFTLGALARNALCSPAGAHAVLDVGRHQSELISFQNGTPVTIRILPWGGENITRALAQSLAVSPEEAEQLKTQSDRPRVGGGSGSSQIETIIQAEIAAFASTIQPNWIGQKLYCSGGGARLASFPDLLAQAIGHRVECERLDAPPGAGRSAAILGLRRAGTGTGSSTPLILSLSRPKSAVRTSPPATGKWAVAAALLVVAVIGLRYAEPVIQKPRLLKRIAEITAYRKQLPNVERDLSFLQYVQTNQTHFLDPITVLANAAPSGMRLDSLAINRRGDLSMRASVRDPQQIVDFRSKLIESGFFSTLSVEEQAPTPDRQKINVRIIGQLSPPSARKLPAVTPPRAEPERPRPTPTSTTPQVTRR